MSRREHVGSSSAVASGSGARRRVRWIAAGVTVALAFAVAGLAAAGSYTGYNTLVRASVSSTGVEANGESKACGISADGRMVAFHSDATNLVSGDTNGQHDVFVRDMETSETIRASVSSSGAQGGGYSWYADMSADGEHVVFYSAASNLVPGDTNDQIDVFVRDLNSGETTRASVSSAGEQGNSASYEAHISADGRFVTFESDATNLVAGDKNGNTDAFVRDLVKGTTTRLSVGKGGVEGNGAAWFPSISQDGRYAVFYSDSYNLIDGGTVPFRYHAYLRDLQFNTTKLLSASPSGAEGNDDTDEAVITPDGKHVAFASTASNLVPNDTNGMSDAFVLDLESGEFKRASVSSGGAQGDGYCRKVTVSADGEHVVFESSSANLVPGDTNGKRDVFAHDLEAGNTVRISVSNAGVQGDSDSERPSVSADGRYVAFNSVSSLVPDINGKLDVFVRDRMKGESALAVTSSSKTLSKYGAKYTFTGKLTTGTTPLPSKLVRLQMSTSASGPWADTPLTALTDATGSFTVLAAPTSKTYYRARFEDPKVEYGSAVSDARQVTPRPSVGTPKAPSRMTKGRSKTVYGYLKPRHTKGTYPIRIYKWKKTSSGKWKKYGYVKAKAYNYRSYTKYKKSIRLSKAGKWRLRAYAPADSRHAKAWSSGYDYVTVK